MDVQRQGEFAIYHGKEYSADVIGKRRLRLFSQAQEDLALGFTPSPWGGFVKEVAQEDVEECFSRYIHGTYHGHEVCVVQKRNDQVEIVPLKFLSEEVRQSLGFQERERGAYFKWVSPEELDRMWEVKRPL